MANIIPKEVKLKETYKTYPTILKRARTLKISKEEIGSCKSIEEFKKLVKTKFRISIKTVHPDRVKGHNGGRTKYGSRYNAKVNAYKWLMALEQSDFDRNRKKYSTVQDIELPIDWGLGWREYSTQYTGYQVLPRI